MAGKRRATYDLNRDNCEDELPKEVAGNWKPAADDALKGRPILKARRSLNTSQSPANSPFSGFSFNLGAPKTSFGTSSSVPNFSFGVSPGTNGNLSSTPKPSGTPNAATPGNQVSVTTCKKSKSDEQESVKKELSIEDQLKEIVVKRQRLLEEKQRIECELQKLDLEEKEIQEEQKSDCISKEASTKQASDDEEIELPPEEPWN